MARPRGHVRGFRSLKAKERTWQLGPGGDDLATLDRASLSSSSSVILGSGVESTLQQITILRIHGFLEILLQSTDAALAGFNWAAGIGIVSADAFATGQAAMPTPFGDIDWKGWMWHEMGAMHSVFGAAAAGDPSDNPVRVEIDVKSMRKIGVNETIFMSFQPGELGTSVLQVLGGTRMLFKDTASN